MTYLITFVCYGSHLHGEEGAIDRLHNQPGAPALPANPRRLALRQRLMDQDAYTMDQSRGEAVLASIIERCCDNKWDLIAAHVRMNHVHVVVDAPIAPERIMTDLKSYASRVLKRAGIDSPGRKRWARHGSTKWLRDTENISSAIKYVTEKQGDPMSVWGRSRIH